MSPPKMSPPPPPPPKEEEEDCSPGCKRRRVQISEAVSFRAPPGVGLTEEELSESWWSAKEFAASKKMAKMMCQESRKARRYSDCLSGAYAKACSLARRSRTTQKQVSEKVIGDETEPEESSGELSVPDTVDEGLLRLAQQDQSPRGLEGYSSRLHSMRRARHLHDSRHAVFVEQARQNVSNKRDDEQIARQAMIASSRARTFATMLGQADALAAAAAADKNSPKAVCSATTPQGEAKRKPSKSRVIVDNKVVVTASTSSPKDHV